jgi:hypothetical protein
MTFAQLVGYAEQLLTLGALLGAIWSAYVFVKSVSERAEAARVSQLNAWRKAGVHKLLHSSRMFMAIDEITSRLRSESFDTSIDVRKNELTPEVVRLLLLEMLEAGTIQQIWGDHFGIKNNDPAVINADRAVVTWNVINHAYRLITLAPGHLSTDQLYDEINKEVDLPKESFVLMLHQLKTMGAASVSEHGKWASVETTARVEKA